MKIIYKIGDLLDAAEHHLCHGTNSLGIMGSGIAAQIKSRFPRAYEVYRNAYDARPDPTRGLDLGTTIWADCGSKVIINAVTQEFFGRDPNTVYVSYEAVRRAIREIDERAQRDFVDTVAFPLIGAGLANGKWSTIASIIEHESHCFHPVVYLRDGKMPN